MKRTARNVAGRGRRYRAAVVVAVAASCASAAHAQSFFEIEAGLGASSAVKQGDGMFYDEGLSHKTPINAFAARAGLQFNLIDAPSRSIIPGLRAHLTYVYWGSLNWNATVAEDQVLVNGANQTIINGVPGGYSTTTKSCLNNQCGQIRTFKSSGNTQSINLTLEPYWNIGGKWTVGVEAGPAVYFGPWNSDYIADESGVFGPAGSVDHNSHRIVPHLGAVVGASISDGPFSVRYEYLFAPAHDTEAGNDVPSGVKGYHMLTLNYTF